MRKEKGRQLSLPALVSSSDLLSAPTVFVPAVTAAAVRFAASMVASAAMRAAPTFGAATTIAVIPISTAVTRTTTTHSAIVTIAASIASIVPTEPSGLVESAAAITLPIMVDARFVEAAETAIIKPLTAEPLYRRTEVLHAPELPISAPEAAVEIERTIVGGMGEVKVIPRAYSDEHSVHEVVRSPVTIRCTSIRIIRIKSVFAHWRRIVNSVGRAYLYPNRNLGLGIHCR